MSREIVHRICQRTVYPQQNHEIVDPMFCYSWAFDLFILRE